MLTSRHLLGLSALTTALALGGCGSNPTNAQIGTGVGAAAGALIGREIGEDKDQRRSQRR